MHLKLALLRQSFEPACPAEGEKQLIAEQFYQTQFAAYPQVRPLFASADMREQIKKMVATLALLFNALTKPDLLIPTLQKLGQRYVHAGVQAAHYPIVAEALLATFAARLGSRWTRELEAAWSEAYETIATLMQKEASLPAVQGERERALDGPC
jgi:hemoglobin-like flavoprotein